MIGIVSARALVLSGAISLGFNGVLTSAFTPSLTSNTLPKHISRSHSARRKIVVESSAVDDGEFMGKAPMLTPAGYGFSSSADRILQSVQGEQKGFYAAKAADPVIDVMTAVTNGDLDVALVYDGGNAAENLLGIFTETDYIEVRIQMRYFHLIETLH